MLEVSLKAHLETLAAGRVHVLKLPEAPIYPALVYQPISEPQRRNIDGTGTPKRTARIQVDAWARGYKSAKELAAVVRNSLGGFAGDLQGTTVGFVEVAGGKDDFDNEAKLYRSSTDLIIHY